ncbi:hypothetical protein NQ314_011697 [Rhamnusium bicolor]|uniref:PiggyBac transposable element-derived protein domain-containing protein n=1 Tax=Rhamnusium bicolor TaxID=1586634 RepID=A0AAV8XH09_9CUCU|nr:hypothetical protein NQ314_011697 [Rhamnusium bicolor]
MGIVVMPAYTDYWSSSYRYSLIADVMPLKRYQALRRYIHFVDNNDLDSDRYFKIRPFLNEIRKKFLEIDEEHKYSIDEMMVPYKGIRAGNRRQYIKNKPRKWGIKNFIRAGVTGMIYDFLIYGGEDTFRSYSFSDYENNLGLGAKVVLALCQTIHQKLCSVVYFDNFFSSLELMQVLRHEYGIFSLGTIRNNRLRGCPLASDPVLKKQGRGSFSQKVTTDGKIVICKWYDNKCVTIASTYTDAYPVGKIKRFCKSEAGKMDVTCPQMIKDYNQHMGGVDLADMLVALYRTELRTHRWYLTIFSQMLDICVNNSWLLYRRDLDVKSKPMPLKEFRKSVATSLLTKNPKRGRPSAQERATKTITNPTIRPTDDIRYDNLNHFPESCPKGRCKHCVGGQTRI